jgi:hypothetical protein
MYIYMCATQKGCVGFWCDRVKSFVALRASVCSRVPTNLGAGEKDGRDTGLFASASNRRHSISQQKLCLSRISKRDHPTRTQQKYTPRRISVCVHTHQLAFCLIFRCKCCSKMQQNSGGRIKEALSCIFTE